MKLRLLLLSLFALTLLIGLNAQTDPGTSNLKHSWTFEDGNPTDAIGGATGTLEGGATIEDGQLLIDAAGEWMSGPALIMGLSAYSELSVTIWFSTLDIPDINPAFAMLWYYGGSETDGVGGTDVFGSNGIFFQPARNDDVCRTAISCGDLATPWLAETGINRIPEITSGDSTFHVVTTIDATTLSLFMNGALVGTADLTGDNSIGNLKDDFFWIGRGGYAGDDNYWCKVDQLEIYDDVLTSDEVLWLYQNIEPSTVENTKYQSFNLNIYSSNGVIYMKNIENADINSVQIFDMSGRTVYQSNVFEEVIHVNLPSSVYIVQVQSNLGQVVKKVSVQ
jgi:hypothetical protein